jgi:hypothetical protein
MRTTQTEGATGPAPDDVGPSDLELRGSPAGLASPTELEEQYPDAMVVVGLPSLSRSNWTRRSA